MKDLKRTMLTEPGPYSERPSRILFEEWKLTAQTSRAQSGDSQAMQELLPLELFQIDDPSQSEALMKLLQKLPEVVIFYLTNLPNLS